MEATNKIVRSICFFTKSPTNDLVSVLENLESQLVQLGYTVQTKRICSPDLERVISMDKDYAADTFIFGLGSLERPVLTKNLDLLLNAREISFNMDLTNREISPADVDILFEIINKKASKTFNFAYVFNNKASSPFFPSGLFAKNGFSVGLQPTNLSENCLNLEEWLAMMKDIWEEILRLFAGNPEFLGIDSSVAPIGEGNSSLINFIKRLGLEFKDSVITDTYLKIAEFLKKDNPLPVGLNGLMLPTLEDFELAEEYEEGNFPIERNLFLSLHSGLGIDTYPLGINENRDKILDILKLTKGLSNKYKKSLSVRFVSDGKARVGEKTQFNNQYLKDVVIRKL